MTIFKHITFFLSLFSFCTDKFQCYNTSTSQTTRCTGGESETCCLSSQRKERWGHSQRLTFLVCLCLHIEYERILLSQPPPHYYQVTSKNNQPEMGRKGTFLRSQSVSIWIQGLHTTGCTHSLALHGEEQRGSSSTVAWGQMLPCPL